jgi:hypothetical protein
MMEKNTIKFVQQVLKQKRLYDGAIDGIAGPITINALNLLDDLSADWPPERKLTGCIQLFSKENNIDPGPVDGFWGPRTQYAYDLLKNTLSEGKKKALFRPGEISPINPNNWPTQADERFLVDYYGPVGENQVRIQLPYPHKLSWDTDTMVNSYFCHSKVHDSLLRLLTKVKEHYGIKEIKRLRLDLWGGCLNVRDMRGGTRYSMHSWGIAVDYDPDRNRLQWGMDRAAFARPEYNDWWQFWEEEGWISLGRARNFDWMHVQAATL